MSTKYVVRRATKNDIPGVLAVASSSAAASQWTEQKHRQMLVDERSVTMHRILLVAEMEGAVVGYAVASVVLTVCPSEVEFENLAVTPNARRQGIGQALLQAILAWSVQFGTGPVRLEVRASNQAAIELYRRNSFVQSGLRRRYYADPEEDAVCMERVLG